MPLLGNFGRMIFRGALEACQKAMNFFERSEASEHFRVIADMVNEVCQRNRGSVLFVGHGRNLTKTAAVRRVLDTLNSGDVY